MIVYVVVVLSGRAGKELSENKGQEDCLGMSWMYVELTSWYYGALDGVIYRTCSGSNFGQGVETDGPVNRFIRYLRSLICFFRSQLSVVCTFLPMQACYGIFFIKVQQTSR